MLCEVLSLVHYLERMTASQLIRHSIVLLRVSDRSHKGIRMILIESITCFERSKFNTCHAF